jgi:predicted acyltransferase
MSSKILPLSLYVLSIEIKIVCHHDWRDGLVIKSTGWSSSGLGFNSQQPHGGSQLSVMGSSALSWCLETVALYSNMK